MREGYRAKGSGYYSGRHLFVTTYESIIYGTKEKKAAAHPGVAGPKYSCAHTRSAAGLALVPVHVGRKRQPVSGLRLLLKIDTV